MEDASAPSREAAKEYSPWREPWVLSRKRIKPRKGRKKSHNKSPDRRENGQANVSHRMGCPDRFRGYPGGRISDALFFFRLAFATVWNRGARAFGRCNLQFLRGVCFANPGFAVEIRLTHDRTAALRLTRFPLQL